MSACQSISTSTPTPSPYAVDNSNCSRPSSRRPRGVFPPTSLTRPPSVCASTMLSCPHLSDRSSREREGKTCLVLFWPASCHPLIGPDPPPPPRDNPPLRLAACETSDACCGLWSGVHIHAMEAAPASVLYFDNRNKNMKHGRCDGLRARESPELKRPPPESWHLNGHSLCRTEPRAAGKHTYFLSKGSASSPTCQ